jgi:multidrug resistance protein, MATE family
VMRRDSFYAPFKLRGSGLHPPAATPIREQLKLGIPMGLAILIEVTGFTFMAIFIARLGTTAVAGHQLAANLVALMFMMPLALSNATSTLVAQAIGAGRLSAARQLGWHGLVLALGLATTVAVVLTVAREPIVRLYTDNPVILAAALPLVAWSAVFHVADAAQAMAAFVLRAWRIATVPVLIYAGSLWGVGLGGGYVLAFNVGGAVPAAWQGALGFWLAATVGLSCAALGLVGFMAWVMRRQTVQATPGPERLAMP